MSLVNQILATSEQVLLNAGHGDDFKVLSGAAAGQTFTARLDVEPVLDPHSELGSDTRMQSVIRLLRPGPALARNDLVQSGGKTWKIIQREDNAASITNDYWVEQQL